MKLWVAHWLRKLAQRIDGDEYVSRTGVYRKAIELQDTIRDEIRPVLQDAVDRELKLGAHAAVGEKPMGFRPRKLAQGGPIDKPKPYLFDVGDEIVPVNFEDRT